MRAQQNSPYPIGNVPAPRRRHTQRCNAPTRRVPGRKPCGKRRGGTHALAGSILALVSGLILAQAVALEAAELRPETIKAWARYAAAAEQRIDRELRSNRGFLAIDYLPQKAAAAERNAVLAGEIPVVKMTAGEKIDVPDGMIHHWRGSVFIPGVDIGLVMSRIVNPGMEDTRQEDVLESRVLNRGPDSLTLYLKLRRVKFVTVVYNTEHEIHYGWRGGSQALSRSVATRIAELRDPGSSGEREKPIGQDRGFLWRLNSYWRYEQMNGGVFVECESISLSRTVPSLLEYFIRPMIDSAARESMARTLGSMRERMIRAAQQNPPDATVRLSADPNNKR